MMLNKCDFQSMLLQKLHKKYQKRVLNKLKIDKFFVFSNLQIGVSAILDKKKPGPGADTGIREESGLQ